jgi:rhamnogalacturonyl hydrolase YesR
MNAENPAELGRLLVDELLSRPDFLLYRVGEVRSIHYAEACAALGALRVAGALGDASLVGRLEARYDIELSATEAEGRSVNTADHVDANVYGIVPLELYKRTGERRFLDQGLALADSQWEDPLPDGMTRQARYWVDDVYMIACLQSLAFDATGDRRYLDRAALAVDAYLRRLQLPGGLFFHGEEAPFAWGRGNGWVAAGLAELLSRLSESDPRYGAIRSGFVRMTGALRRFQREDGMWPQLIDRADSWEESSATAMFGFALRAGARAGILDPRDCAPSYERAWRALAGRVGADGLLGGICAGTGQSGELEYYLARPRVRGDLHGQAAMLWFCAALMERDG